jgi:hypothetical protein
LKKQTQMKIRFTVAKVYPSTAVPEIEHGQISHENLKASLGVSEAERQL